MKDLCTPTECKLVIFTYPVAVGICHVTLALSVGRLTVVVMFLGQDIGATLGGGRVGVVRVSVGFGVVLHTVGMTLLGHTSSSPSIATSNNTPHLAT